MRTVMSTTSSLISLQLPVQVRPIKTLASPIHAKVVSRRGKCSNERRTVEQSQRHVLLFEYVASPTAGTVLGK